MVAVLGLCSACALYVNGLGQASRLSERFSALHRLLLGGWGVDALVQRVFIAPVIRFAGALYVWLDRLIIDRAVEGVGTGSQFIGRFMANLQSGETDVYASLAAVGFIVLMGIVLWIGR
jgi:NADH:ubiquinone oxidoreductase subunit 5 (subunit L)/multisubunit Na+/H+ antiporter MnhA subunit